MNQQEAMLRYIIEHPEDDTPRLAYADLSDECGRPDQAARVRLKEIPLVERAGRSAKRQAWAKYVLELVPAHVRPSGVIMLDSYPHRPWRAPVGWAYGENPNSWEYRYTGSSLGRNEFVFGIRHGFISAVAAGSHRLRRVLPSLVQCQPVHHIGVLGIGVLEYESNIRAMSGVRSRGARVIRLRYNKIPPEVFARLSPRPDPDGRERICVYLNATSACEDLGRAFLDWARNQPVEDGTEISLR